MDSAGRQNNVNEGRKAGCKWEGILVANADNLLVGMKKTSTARIVSTTQETEWNLKVTPLDYGAEDPQKPFISLEFVASKYESKTAIVSCRLELKREVRETCLVETLQGIIIKEGDKVVLCTATEARTKFQDNVPSILLIKCDLEVDEQRYGEQASVSGEIQGKDMRTEAKHIDDGLTDVATSAASQSARKRETTVESAESEWKSTLQEDYGRLFDEHEFGDVVLVAGGKEIIAYKGILSARCPYFRKMFRGKSLLENRRIEIEGVEFEVLEEIVRYLYCDRLPNVTCMPKKLFMAAEKFELSQLKQTCEEEISAKMTINSVADDLLLATLHGADDLKERTVEFVKKHKKQVFATPEWKQLSRKHVNIIGEIFLDLMDS